MKKHISTPKAPPIPCRGVWWYTINGDEFDCEYEHAGEVTCDHCIVNREDGLDPRTGKKYRKRKEAKP